MKTNPRKTIQKIWLGAAVMFALLLVIGTPRTALGQWTTSGNDISNANTGNEGVGLTGK